MNLFVLIRGDYMVPIIFFILNSYGFKVSLVVGSIFGSNISLILDSVVCSIL